MSVTGIYDGFISRHINRRFSEPLAKLLAGTPMTPNQATWLAFGIAVISGVVFASGFNIVGGILAQLSSIADGVDGGLARRKKMTSDFGGFLDSVLDRYADAAIIMGLSAWSLSHETYYPGGWAVGFAALAGTFAVSYSRARIAPEQRLHFDRGLASVASRDVRLFVIMLGGLTGQAYLCLAAIAIITNAAVLYRLYWSYRNLAPAQRPPPSQTTREQPS